MSEVKRQKRPRRRKVYVSPELTTTEYCYTKWEADLYMDALAAERDEWKYWKMKASQAAERYETRLARCLMRLTEAERLLRDTTDELAYMYANYHGTNVVQRTAKGDAEFIAANRAFLNQKEDTPCS